MSEAGEIEERVSEVVVQENTTAERNTEQSRGSPNGTMNQSGVLKQLKFKTLRSLEPTEVKQFLEAYERLLVNYRTDPASDEAAKLDYWVIEDVKSAIKITEAKTSEEITHEFLLEYLRRKATPAETEITWDAWFNKRNNIRLAFMGKSQGEAQLTQLVLKIVKSAKEDQRGELNLKLRPHRKSFAVILAKVLPAKYRTLFIDRMKAKLSIDPNYTLYEEPDVDEVKKIWTEVTNMLNVELDTKNFPVGKEIDPNFGKRQSKPTRDRQWKKKKVQGLSPNREKRDKNEIECYRCHKLGHFARECRSPWTDLKTTGEAYGKRKGFGNANKFAKSKSRGSKKVRVQDISAEAGDDNDSSEEEQDKMSVSDEVKDGHK